MVPTNIIEVKIKIKVKIRIRRGGCEKKKRYKKSTNLSDPGKFYVNQGNLGPTMRGIPTLQTG